MGFTCAQGFKDLTTIHVYAQTSRAFRVVHIHLSTNHLQDLERRLLYVTALSGEFNSVIHLAKDVKADLVFFNDTNLSSEMNVSWST